MEGMILILNGLVPHYMGPVIEFSIHIMHGCNAEGSLECLQRDIVAGGFQLFNKL